MSAIDKAYITGYCDRLSVKPGETIRFMLSAVGVVRADVQVVRLLHGDEIAGGPGFQEREVDVECNGEVVLEHQPVQAGSYVVVPDASGALLPDGSFTVHAFIWPTTPGKGRQGLVTQWSAPQRRGWGLGINGHGRLAFWVGDGSRVAEIACDRALDPRIWYFVAAAFNADAGTVVLHQTGVVNAYNSLLSPILEDGYSSAVAGPLGVRPQASGGALLMAGYHDASPERGEFVAGLYNGKIDRSGLQRGVLSDTSLKAMAAGAEPSAAGIIARWDPTIGYTADGIGDTVIDSGPHARHGYGYNRPVRAMTGHNWNSKDDSFRVAPAQFGAIYFNDDAIIDCGWQPTLEWTLPQDFPSGVYAARVRGGQCEDHLTFFVRPQTPQARIAMLMPTASYLAYANERFVLQEAPGVEAISAHTLVLHDWDYFLADHTEFGLSTYDHHADGAGVCYSSYRRPVMMLRPRHRMAGVGIPWQFPADLSIIWWLENCGHAYDVITDEDLDREGVACLEPYNVVLTGTHPEYYSERMVDGTDDYLKQGGRVMYLGGNGFYWVVAFRDEEPWCMEVRKLNSGSRAWQAAPGEHYMATTGTKGGLWRDRGRAPNKAMAIAFTSEGMDECKPYRRMPDSYEPAAAWIFEGVGEVFGADGLALGGAAGVEIDRYDLRLGTPPGTLLLACSEGHSDNYPKVVEEIAFTTPGLGGTQDYQIRGDMVLSRTKNDGAVFATGSIAWGQALPWNDGNNDVARITLNVLETFMQDSPLPG